VAACRPHGAVPAGTAWSLLSAGRGPSGEPAADAAVEDLVPALPDREHRQVLGDGLVARSDAARALPDPERADGRRVDPIAWARESLVRMTELAALMASDLDSVLTNQGR